MKWPRWSQRIWTKSLTATITPWKKPVAPTCVIVLWVWVFKVLQMPFLMMKLPFESDEARKLNEDIFETIYFAACEASCELAEIHGPYETYAGSPASKGLLQFDLWGRVPSSGRWDWQGLKAGRTVRTWRTGRTRWFELIGIDLISTLY